MNECMYVCMYVCMCNRSAKIGKAAADTTIGKKAQEVGNSVKDRIEGALNRVYMYACMWVYVGTCVCMYVGRCARVLGDQSESNSVQTVWGVGHGQQRDRRISGSFALSVCMYVCVNIFEHFFHG